MKQAFLKLTGKKFITAAVLSASVLLTSFVGNAAPAKSSIEIISGQNTVVNFAGSTDDALLFHVHVNNLKGDEFTLTIRDNNNNILFTKSFSDVTFDKNFKLLKGEDSGERYTFKITSSNKSLEDTYVVSSNTRVVNDVAVNKL